MGAWIVTTSQSSGSNPTPVKATVWVDTIPKGASLASPQPAPPKGKTYTGTAAKTWAQVAAEHAVGAAQGTVRTLDVPAGQQSVWENGNYVTKNLTKKQTWQLLPYAGKSPTTGQPLPDLTKYPAPPAGYPYPTDPTIPLDDKLPACKGATRYGGLSAGGGGQWDWLSWRKRCVWNTGEDPGSLDYAIKLLSPKEQSFFGADYAHSNKDYQTVLKVTEVAMVTTLAAVTVVGVAGAVSASAAAPAAASSGVPAAAGPAALSTTAPSLATMAGSGSMVGAGAAGAGSAAAAGATAAAGIGGTGLTISGIAAAAPKVLSAVGVAEKLFAGKPAGANAAQVAQQTIAAQPATVSALTPTGATTTPLSFWQWLASLFGLA